MSAILGAYVASLDAPGQLQHALELTQMLEDRVNEARQRYDGLNDEQGDPDVLLSLGGGSIAPVTLVADAGPFRLPGDQVDEHRAWHIEVT